MKRMKRMTTLLLLVCFAGTALAQSRNTGNRVMKELKENGPVYVNTKAPGVHKEYDERYGCEVWKNSMGSYICRDENMKPLHEIDKDFKFTGTNNDPDNPNASYNVKKEWDDERGCYVWRDNMGNFLGRDKPSDDKQQEWLEKKEKEWLEKNGVPKGKVKSKQKAGKIVGGSINSDDGGSEYTDTEEDMAGGMSYDELVRLSAHGAVNPSRVIIRSDDELRRAEQGLIDAQNAAAEVLRLDPSANINEYIDQDLLRKVEDAINEYKRKHNMQ